MYSIKTIWLLVATCLLGMVAGACGSDEPSADPQRPEQVTPSPSGGGGQDPGGGGGGQQPGGGGGESQPLTITITPITSDCYAGGNVQLTATPSREATVTWHSSNESVVWVDASGLATIEPITSDASVIVTAKATATDGKTATADIALHCRTWNVGWRNGDQWSTSAIQTAAGKVFTLSLLDSNGQPIANDSFNPTKCQWTVLPTVLSGMATVTANNTSAQVLVSEAAAAGTEMYIQARHGRVATSQRIIVTF